jgi:hypothetical protein
MLISRFTYSYFLEYTDELLNVTNTRNTRFLEMAHRGVDVVEPTELFMRIAIRTGEDILPKNV